jgi:hypothetical protein
MAPETESKAKPTEATKRSQLSQSLKREFSSLEAGSAPSPAEPGEELKGRLASEQAASCGGFLGIGGFPALRNAADDAFAVDHKSDALGDANQRVQHAVLPRHRLGLIAQHRELQAQLGGESFVARRGVHADPKYLRAGPLEFGDISLIRQELLPSAGRKGADVEGKHHAPLAAKVAELDEPSVLVVESEVGRRLAHAQRAAGPAARCDCQCKNPAWHSRSSAESRRWIPRGHPRSSRHRGDYSAVSFLAVTGPGLPGRSGSGERTSGRTHERNGAANPYMDTEQDKQRRERECGKSG